MKRRTVTYLPMKDLSTKDNEQESAANCQERAIRTSQGKLKEQGFALHPLSGVGHSELSKVLVGSDGTIRALPRWHPCHEATVWLGQGSSAQTSSRTTAHPMVGEITLIVGEEYGVSSTEKDVYGCNAVSGNS
jgi:hypothetical protein